MSVIFEQASSSYHLDEAPAWYFEAPLIPNDNGQPPFGLFCTVDYSANATYSPLHSDNPHPLWTDKVENGNDVQVLDATVKSD